MSPTGKSGNTQKNNSGGSYIICCETQSTHELGQTLTVDPRLADPMMKVTKKKKEKEEIWKGGIFGTRTLYPT